MSEPVEDLRICKYVVAMSYRIETPLVFPDGVVRHADAIREQPGAIDHGQIMAGLSIVSAGFCTLNPVRCWGSSTSLGRSSRGEQDEELIRRSLGLS